MLGTFHSYRIFLYLFGPLTVFLRIFLTGITAYYFGLGGGSLSRVAAMSLAGFRALFGIFSLAGSFGYLGLFSLVSTVYREGEVVRDDHSRGGCCAGIGVRL